MKKYILALVAGLLIIAGADALAVGIPYSPYQGGTGTSTIPTLGYILIGQSNGTYGPQATSTLGISGGGGNTFAFPFTPTTNYGAATQSTTTPIWDTLGFQGSSTSQFAYASTTAVGATATFFVPLHSLTDASGNIIDWNGNELHPNSTSGSILGDSMFPWATGYIQTLNLSTPLTVANGGTGNTSFASSTVAISDGTKLYGFATSSLYLNASASNSGLLSSTDWSTFNGKQASGSYITGLTGDVTASGPGSAATTLATVNSNVGTFQGLTINGKGLVTAATNQGYTTNTGTVTSVATNNGITGGTITTTGTIGLATISQGVLGNVGSASAVPTSVATSSLFTFSPGFSAGNTLQQIEHPSFQYATSTTWTATTTIYLQIGYGEVFNSVRCATDVGTLSVDFYHSTNHLNYILTASTTANVNAFTTNNTITAGDLTKVDIGTPASSPTRIICTIADTY